MPQMTAKEALVEMRNRVLFSKAEFYEPHANQLKMHKSQARIRAAFAGNRWGKTYAMAMELFYHVSKTHPYWKPLATGPVKARACCVDYPTLEKSMIEDTFHILVPRRYLKGGSWDTAWNDKKKVLRFTHQPPIYGGFIEFLSYEQKTEAFAGVARHIIWEDEEAPEPIHRENMARLSTTKGIMVMTLTPIKPSLWIVSEIYEKAETDKNIEIFEGVATENPYVDKDTIDMMLSQINDPVEREARLSGKFTWYAGKIYPEYGELHYVDPFVPPDDWDLVLAMDPHDTKPTAMIYGFWSPMGDFYIMGEKWLDGGWEYICNEIKMGCEGRVSAVDLIDPSSDRDPKIHETESIYIKFQEYFPDIIKWISKPGSVWNGIQDVKTLMKKNKLTNLPKLFVCAKNCPMTDWQLKHYGLKPPSAADQYRYDPKPIKIKDDFCDCVRGAVMFGPPNPQEARRGQRPEEDKFGMKSYH